MNPGTAAPGTTGAPGTAPGTGRLRPGSALPAGRPTFSLFSFFFFFLPLLAHSLTSIHFTSLHSLTRRSSIPTCPPRAAALRPSHPTHPPVLLGVHTHTRRENTR